MTRSIPGTFPRVPFHYTAQMPSHSGTLMQCTRLVVIGGGVLTAAEQHLVRTQSPDTGRDLLKDVRTQLIEIARPVLEALIETITGSKVVSLHHDISTVVGEDVILFSLNSTPAFRATSNKD